MLQTMVPVRQLSGYHFDTFKFVERLEAEGFTREQSEAIMASLREVISERYFTQNCSHRRL